MEKSPRPLRPNRISWLRPCSNISDGDWKRPGAFEASSSTFKRQQLRRASAVRHAITDADAVATASATVNISAIVVARWRARSPYMRRPPAVKMTLIGARPRACLLAMSDFP